MTSTEIDDAYEALRSRIDARARVDARDVASASFAPTRARADAAEKKSLDSNRASAIAARAREAPMDDLERWRAPRLAATREGTPCARAYWSACVALGARTSARAMRELDKRDADVSSSGLGTRGARAIAAGVAENAVTESLDVSRNQIGDDGVSALCLAATRAKRLSALNFSENRVSRAIGATCAEAVKRVRALNFSGCGVDDACAKSMCEALAASTCALERLNLSRNRLTNAIGASIEYVLKCRSTLKSLDVSWNALGADACECVSRGLRENRRLEFLSLAWNGVGDEGGKRIGEALEVNRSLTELDLSRCRLGCDACMVISEGLRTNDVLATLRLDHNPCGEDGGRHLMSMLLVNDTLTTLTLEGSSFVDVPRGKHRTSAKRAFVAENPHNLGRPTAIESEDFDNIARQLRNRRLSDFERLARLKMFCRVYYFETQHTAKLLETFILEGTDRLQAASACYARLLDAENAERMFKSKSEYAKLRKIIGSFEHFRAANPTGRYELNLAFDIDRTIASTMMDSATFEGRRRTWRNVRMGRAAGVDLLPSGVPERLTRDIPNVGTLCFDYTSNIRPPEDATAPSDEELHEILRTKSVLTPAVDAWEAVKSSDALYALREASVRVYVTSTQYERVCNAFAAGADRVEASVILFNRVIDRAAVARVVGRMSCFEQSFFGCRIGWRNVLGDSLQSYTMHYRLDLSCDEQMSVAKHLVTCAVREYGDVQVIRNVTINGRRLSRDPVEDDTLWSVLTAESFTPTLEFDYFGADVWTVVERELGIAHVPKDKPEREAALKRLATRLAFVRAVALHGPWVEYTDATNQHVDVRATTPPSRADAAPLWRRAWRDLLSDVARAERLLENDRSPLRCIFDLLDNDASGTLSIDELLSGANLVLGRPIPRAAFEPHVHVRHLDDSRDENVVSFDVFVAACLRAFPSLDHPSHIEGDVRHR